MASWYQAIDSDVIPMSIAQFTNSDEVAVLGKVNRLEGNSFYQDGVALQISAAGTTVRLDLPPIDQPLPFPSEVSTNPYDAEFSSSGELYIAGASASDLAIVDFSPEARIQGEPSVWRGTFATEFAVTGLGIPPEFDPDGGIRAISLRNGVVSVGNHGRYATHSINLGTPMALTNDGERIRGMGSATNGTSLIVTDFIGPSAFVCGVAPDGTIGVPKQLERPEDVFRVFGIAMSDNGWMSGFGEVYDVETGDTTSVTLVWRPDGTLAKRIEIASQFVESRVISDGVVFYELNPNFGFLGNQGNYVYLTATDTYMLLGEWMQSLGLIIQFSPDQRVVDAEWSFNSEWLNILVASNVPGESIVIHLDESEVRRAARPWTNPDNYLNVNDDAGSLVTPIDALIILNKLNQQTDNALPYPRVVNPNEPFYYDTSKDGFLTALDALLVINELNSPTATLSIGEYDIPPVELPAGFEPWSSTQLPSGTYIVAGSNGNAAYIEISKKPDGTHNVSSVYTLPSLDVVAGGTRNAGIIRDVNVNSRGELEFVGSSSSPNEKVDPNFREGTVWNFMGVPTATGILPGADESQMFAGSMNGLYAGGSRNDPTLFSTTHEPINLTQSEFGIVVAISADGKVVAGSGEGRIAYWTANVVGFDYTEHSVEIPSSGFDNGGIFAVQGNWLVGVYFSEPALDFVGAVWDARNGTVVYDFVASGPVSSMTATAVNGTAVVVSNPIFGGNPYIYLEGETRTRSLDGILPNLPWGKVNGVRSLVDNSKNNLALTALTSSGRYIFASFKTFLKPR